MRDQRLAAEELQVLTRQSLRSAAGGDDAEDTQRQADRFPSAATEPVSGDD
jgi:hypothetical protein